MILKILRFPHPILRKTAKAIKKVTPEIVKLIDNMIETMRAAPGVGLAAPQVGESIRLFVADIGEGPVVMINPKILKKKGKQTLTEGCLCLPGIEAPIERASYVKMKGLNRQGQPYEIEAEGLLATVLQHENDHLDGFVFIDRVKDPSLITHVARRQEKKEELV
jgi:peptide deformylase